MNPLSFKGVDDLRQLYDAVSDDQLIANMFVYQDTVQMARMAGVKLPRRYVPERQIVEVIRNMLQLPETPVIPCCGTVFEGRRWLAVNADRPITYWIDALALEGAMRGAVDIVHEEMERLFVTYGIEFAAAQRFAVPDFTLGAQYIDGGGGTLGFVASYNNGDDPDIDVGEDEFVSAELVMDAGELWYPEYFRTVFIHELLHVVGLPHAPRAEDDIMLPFYGGDRVVYGNWSNEQLIQRYIGAMQA